MRAVVVVRGGGSCDLVVPDVFAVREHVAEVCEYDHREY
jgi:hypothetical protein